MNVAGELRAIRMRTGLSMKAWAQKLGYADASSYQRYEEESGPYSSGRPLPNSLAEKILTHIVAKKLGDPVITAAEVWRLTGKPSDIEEVPPKRAELIEVPIYDFGIPAGPGAWVEEDPEPVDMQPFRLSKFRSLTRSPLHKVAIGIVSGDSMEPKLFNGDMVMVDTAQQNPRDGLFVVRLFGELMIKRITVGPGRIDVSSDNPSHRSYENVNQDDLHIVGRVIWLMRKM